jgi:hypothetical protein
MESIRLRFQERHSANAPKKKLLATLVSKYHLGSTRFYFPVLKQSKSNPISGTKMLLEYNHIMKAVDLELKKEDWLFAICQKVWARSA